MQPISRDFRNVGETGRPLNQNSRVLMHHRRNRIADFRQTIPGGTCCLSADAQHPKIKLINLILKLDQLVS